MLKDAAGVELPPPARKTIDLEGRIVKDGVRKTVAERQAALNDLVKAFREFRKFTDEPLTLRGGDYAATAHARRVRAPLSADREKYRNQLLQNRHQ